MTQTHDNTHVEINYVIPPDSASICIVALDREIAQGSSKLYEMRPDAEQAPLVHALFSVSNVASIL